MKFPGRVLWELVWTAFFTWRAFSLDAQGREWGSGWTAAFAVVGVYLTIKAFVNWARA